MIRVTSLRSIMPLLQVKDIDASIRFYVDRLGFQQEFRDHEGGNFTMLKRDGCAIALVPKHVAVDLRNATARQHQHGSIRYACFDLHIDCEPGTIDALWQEFHDAGVPMHPMYDRGPMTQSYGIRDFCIFDPDGYDIAFGAPVEVECPNETAGQA